MTSTTTQPRLDNLARAQARAVAAGLRSYRVAGHEDVRFVTRQRDPGLGYLVTLLPDGDAYCSCAASSFDRICAHLALVLADQPPALMPVATLSDDALADEAAEWDRVAERRDEISDDEHRRCYAVHEEVARRDALRYEAEMAAKQRQAAERDAGRAARRASFAALFGPDEPLAVAR